ncbi:Transcriptional regulator, AbiEi antitoxin, Type IV TA system [Krasilnikoviella flava]|uniref:Transcriptional regulator, AbiEi antitoxin, Type IV TA system n=1 Tax=Krasilnikoviella flava TaxID=526729 RepID=A0A1T5I779_9MICO|nr:Transcriptional regulator, AbiEi antitoxin, Type IV TA system [Krasilnikoviella flava]
MRYDEAWRSVIERRASRGELVRVRRGQYTGPASSDGGVARQREQRVLALVAATAATLRTAYCFSHETAALLHGLWVYRLAEEVHVSQGWKPKVRRGSGSPVHRHPVDLPAKDRTVVPAGLPVSTLERTMVDCARWLPGERALVVADSAFRAGADRRVAEAVLAEAAGKPGVRQARRIVELADARSESVGETRLRWLLDAAGLEPPDLAVAVDTWRGTVWIDLGWPGLAVGIEFDGTVKYSGGEYGDPRERLLAEKRRHDALTEAGWTLLHVTWEDLADPDRLVARIRRALAEAARRQVAR